MNTPLSLTKYHHYPNLATLSFKNRFPYISVIDKASDFKFGMQLGFAKAHHLIPVEENWVWPWARKTSQNLELPL